jgi:hypothetical protein
MNKDEVQPSNDQQQRDNDHSTVRSCVATAPRCDQPLNNQQQQPSISAAASCHVRQQPLAADNSLAIERSTTIEGSATTALECLAIDSKEGLIDGLHSSATSERHCQVSKQNSR